MTSNIMQKIIEIKLRSLLCYSAGAIKYALHTSSFGVCSFTSKDPSRQQGLQQGSYIFSISSSSTLLIYQVPFYAIGSSIVLLKSQVGTVPCH